MRNRYDQAYLCLVRSIVVECADFSNFAEALVGLKHSEYMFVGLI